MTRARKTKNNADAATEERVVQWATEKTIVSPLNKRKIYDPDRMDELRSLIKQHGIRRPLLARPTPDPDIIEIVDGSRRRLVAVEEPIPMVPVIIRAMSDREVLDAQIAEEHGHCPFTPLEEAAIYESYLLEQKFDVEAIAERVARPVKHVVLRLRLLALSEQAKAALELGPEQIGGITLGAAEQLARFPANLHDDALPRLQRTELGAPMSGIDAARFLAQRYTLQLVSPGFDPEDAGLVPAAGRCSKCLKRTDNQPMLFPELANGQCTDPPCFRAKQNAAWAIRADTYKAKGCEVLEANELRIVFGGAQSSMLASAPCSSRYVDLENKVFVDGGEKTYREILGGSAIDATIKVARHPDSGAVFELLSATDAAKLLETRKQEGKLGEIPRSLEAKTGEGKARKASAKAADKARRALNRALMAETIKAIEKSAPSLTDRHRLLARMVAREMGGEVLVEVIERRGLTDETRTPLEIIDAHVEQCSARACDGLIFEMLASRGLTTTPAPELKQDGVVGQMLDTLGIDWIDAVQRAKKATGTAHEAPVKPTKRKKADASPVDPKAGSCRVCGCTDRKPCGTTSSPCTWVPTQEATATQAGLCSFCDEVAMAIVEVLRSKLGKDRLDSVIGQTKDEHPDLQFLLDEPSRVKGAIEDLKARGVIWTDDKDILIERDPDEHDDEDPEDDDLEDDDEDEDEADDEDCEDEDDE